MIFLSVKRLVLFLGSLKAIKNIMGFFPLFVFPLKAWFCGLKPPDGNFGPSFFDLLVFDLLVFDFLDLFDLFDHFNLQICSCKEIFML